MIRYSCDLCGRALEASGLRYVVKVEVFAVLDPAASNDADDDCEHLEEIQEILENLDAAEDDQIGDDVHHRLRFDLCPECRKKFLQNPLGREAAKAFRFSEN
jgi:hypothetical protein